MLTIDFITVGLFLYMAAIDLGSNSFYLLVSKTNAQGQCEPVEGYKERVQLRAGLQEDYSLLENAQQRAFDCFKKFRKVLDQYPVERARAVGTYTLRVAQGCEDFIQQGSQILGVPIEIISGEEEARLIYLGAMTGGVIREPHLVLDIGGGSTELILGEAGLIQQCVSLNMGCLEYQLKFFQTGLMMPEYFDTAIQSAIQTIKPVASQFHGRYFSRCLGGSGTLRELMNILGSGQDLVPYSMTREDLETIKNRLINCHDVRQMKIEGLREDRHNVIAGGLCVLIALFDVLAISSIELSCGAIREGILFELARAI